jgi:inosine/xanthosine triphosphatase
MQVVVGSENPVKLVATQQAFNKFYDEVEIVSATVASGVNPFPMTQHEAMKGAINRAEAAWIAFPDTTFAVGIESGVYELMDRNFVQAFAVVKQKTVMGFGASIAFEVSPSLIAFLDPSRDESKSTIDTVVGRKNLFQNEGLVGVFTENRLTRTQILRDAVIAAFPRFCTPQHFTEG